MDTITLCHKLCHTVHNSEYRIRGVIFSEQHTAQAFSSVMTSFPVSSGRIPAVGYGCWKVSRDRATELVEGVIRAGYRHIDGACDYGNEKEVSWNHWPQDLWALLRQVGLGIRNVITSGLVTRKDLFVTSKLWNTYHEPQHVEAACRKSLNDLGLEYLDLYLIHFPISLKFVPFEKRYPPEWLHDPESEDKKMEFEDVPVKDTWRAMEALVEKGLVRNIGVSNWNCQGLRDLFSYAKIKPTVLQVKSKNMYTKHKYMSLPSFCRSRCTHTSSVSGWSPTPSPLGCMSPPSPPLVTASHTPPSATGTMWRSK